MKNLVNRQPISLFDIFEGVVPSLIKEVPARMDFPKLRLNLDVKENENNYEVTADLPGVAKEDVNVKMKNGILTISLKKNQEQNNERTENSGFLIKERRSYNSEVSRSLDFADSVSDDIEAKLENGVLTLVLSKVNEKNNEKVIEIK
jgi:HSP20 family molecular chaperone IbpA